MRSPTPPERVRFLPSVLYTPRSSSRPGCRSLTPVTRVRTPLGALLDATVVSGRKAHGVASAADRVRVPAVALDGALGGQDGGLHPPERGSIPRGSTSFPQIENRSRGSRSRESLKASPVGAATAAWRHRSAVGRRTHALGRAWWCGSAVSRVGRVRLPSRALTRRSSADRAPPCDGGGRRFESSRRGSFSFASATPPSGIAPLGSPPAAGQIPEGVGFAAATANDPPTAGRLGRRRSDMAVERGSIPRSSISP